MAEDIDLHSAMRGELMLPDICRPARFEGKVLDRSEGQGDWSGLGLPSQAISPEDESALIDVMTWLESHR